MTKNSEKKLKAETASFGAEKGRGWEGAGKGNPEGLGQVAEQDSGGGRGPRCSGVGGINGIRDLICTRRSERRRA